MDDPVSEGRRIEGMKERAAEEAGRGNFTLAEYKVLFENVPAYIAVVDHGYRIVKANQRFKDTFGEQVGEFCYRAYKGLPEKCRPCPVEQAFRRGKLQVNEEVGKTKDGREIYYLVYAAPIFDSRGKVRYALEMSLDLTEKKSLEESFQASREFLDNLVENSMQGIAAADASGRLIVFNQAAERILGFQASEMIGRSNLETFLPRNLSRKIMNALGQKGGEKPLRAVDQEVCFRSKEGKRIPVRFSAVALAPRKALIGAVIFFQDLRPLKALEREKTRAEKLAMVGQTIAGLAHGVKNIITGLEGGVYVVQTALKRKDDRLLHRGWEMLERNLEKTSNLVRDLLSFSREKIPDRRWTNPNRLAEEVCSLFRERARRESTGLHLDLDPLADPGFLDPKEIHTCLTNLLSNALDACLSDPQKKPHQVILRTRRGPNEEVVFEVEDNGPGIQEEVREKLFASFFSTKGTSGTGLGLLVTQKIAQEHGGTLSMETEPGRGSLFRMILPQEEHDFLSAAEMGPGEI
jgi:PAS domain S-box-containing protein